MNSPRVKVRLLKEHMFQNRTFAPRRILEVHAGTAQFLVRTGRGELVDRNTPVPPPVEASPLPPIPPTPN